MVQFSPEFSQPQVANGSELVYQVRFASANKANGRWRFSKYKYDARASGSEELNSLALRAGIDPPHRDGPPWRILPKLWL